MISQRNEMRRGRRAAVGVILTCALALTGPGLAGAQTTGHLDLPDAMPGDRLLVTQRTASGMDLHTVNLDASDRTVLTAGNADFEGTWSPDGRHVAFHRVEAGGDGLWVVPAGGGDARRLADGGNGLSWSPDATHIVHSPSTEANLVTLTITDLAGTSTPLPDSAGGIDPSWSPDGAQIAYLDPLRDLALVITRVDGGSDRTVSPGPATDPTWSPAGDRVAYIQRHTEGPHLMVIDSSGSETFFLTDRFARIQQLAYSPSGSHLVFAAAEQDGDHLDLWTVRVADGELQRLTDDVSENPGDEPADDFGPSWSASGGWIAFTRTPDLAAGDAPRDVMIVPAAGGPIRQVTDTGSDHTVAFAPGLTMRVAGADRIATAVTLSRTFDTAATAVIVRADDYPDALAAAPLAATVGGPILLTGRDGLNPSVAAELVRLGTTAVYLLGGHAALSPQVEADLAAAGIADVTRLAGGDRFATAARVLDQLGVLGGGFSRIFIVEGQHADPARGWPDALSAAGASAHTLDPILLVTRDRVPAETASALQAHAAARATIVGGTGAVSEEVAQQIGAVMASVERMPGADRYETSTRAADLAVFHGASAAHPWLVTGHDWPDALVAAPAAARDGGVLLLVDGRDPVGSAATHAWLPGRDTSRGVVVGGIASIIPGVRAAIESSLISGP